MRPSSSSGFPSHSQRWKCSLGHLSLHSSRKGMWQPKAEIERRVAAGFSSAGKPPARSIGQMMLTVAIGCCMVQGPTLPESQEPQYPWCPSEPNSRLAQELQSQVHKRRDLWSLRFRELKRKCRAQGLGFYLPGLGRVAAGPSAKDSSLPEAPAQPQVSAQVPLWKEH